MFFAEVSVYRAGHQQVPPEETQMLVVCQPGLLCAIPLWKKKKKKSNPRDWVRQKGRIM